MTEKDKQLIKKAENLKSVDWALCIEYEEEAESEEAKNILHSMARGLYHTDEYWGDLL